MATCDCKVFPFDVQDDHRTLVIQDRRDHGADTLAASCPRYDEMVAAATILRAGDRERGSI